ncbi:MAG: zinc metallopeptidase [Opitutus sp.]|nr:zinc metallopeptidase [Opitutus sp.]MCS6246948.1 zinc metallopeptidase [Opitutus sp.]MCS6273169.1 zinc metallopeptidase [Opitutus sp.]MCS6279074.1 zinc metallopeptidase [Opitutus sp.]MCS6298591.1 zinc metallopeptidase [Opitutus sp.]
MNSLWYLAILIGPFLFGLYAQMRVHGAYNKNVQIPSRGRITGREAADAVMRSAGITNVEIVEVPGQLTDHYDPIHRRLALSELNYNGTSLAALGVAAHEAGHAIQHKVGYSMMTVRQTIAPATQIAAGVSNYVIMAGILMLTFLKGFGSLGYSLLMIGAVALAVIVLFQLVTLPVEFDASRRAKKQLVTLGILDKDEIKGANETLDAAALTYVAAFVAALGSLLHVVMMLMGSNRREE